MEKDNGEKITSLILKGENMENLIYLAPIAGIIAVIFAGIKAAMINKSDAGNEKMKKFPALLQKVQRHSYSQIQDFNCIRCRTFRSVRIWY